MPRVVLETPRLRLREFADDLSDAPALNEIQSDPVHMRFYPHPFSMQESREWIERMLDRYERHGFGLWAVEDGQTGQFLGNVGPVLQRVDDEEHVELGWSITPKRARQGIATEAARVCRDHCFDVMGIDHLIALVLPANEPSRGVALNIGMTVWKQSLYGSVQWLHDVFRIRAEDRPKLGSESRGGATR